MLTFLVFALTFCLIAGFVAGLGVGIGFLLKACISSLDLGHAIIAGCITAFAAVYFFRSFMHAVQSHTDDEDGIPDDDPVVVLPKDLLDHLQRSARPRRRRR